MTDDAKIGEDRVMTSSDSDLRKLSAEETEALADIGNVIIDLVRSGGRSPAESVNILGYAVVGCFLEAGTKATTNRLEIFDKWATAVRMSIEMNERQMSGKEKMQ